MSYGPPSPYRDGRHEMRTFQRAAAGPTEPSPAARLMTTRLYSAGELLGGDPMATPDPRHSLLLERSVAS